jgi:hypothetical protein
LDLAVTKERVEMLEYKIELLNHKLEVAVADSEHRKHKYKGMLDPSYGPVDSSRSSSRKSVKITAMPTRTKWSNTAMKSTPSKQDSGNWFLPLR